MRNFVATLVLTLTAHTQFAQTLNNPESVEIEPTDGSYYISNTGTSDILKLSPNGTLSYFANPTQGTYGLELVGDTLYACMGGTLVGFNRLTGTQIITANLGGNFLNGITHDATNLYITDFNNYSIIRYNYHTGQFNTFVSGLAKKPNGIIYDHFDNRLVYVTWGSNAAVMAVNLSDSSVSALKATSLGNMDGIAMNCNGDFMIATWSPNQITLFDHLFTGSGINMGVTGLSSPADIFFDTNSDTLCIPNTGTDGITKFHSASCFNSIEQLTTSNKEMVVWPNPATESVTISQLPVHAYVRIFDVTGKEPRMPVKLNRNGSNATLDISSFPSGMYFIHVISGQHTQVLRVVKNK